MKLIVFNYESNSNSRFSFALDWINELAKNVDKLYVISLRCGCYEETPFNVEIHCINQDKKNRIQTIFGIWKSVREIHQKDKTIDGYFIHMAHYFVPLVYPFAKFHGQKMLMWKAHKSVTPLVKVSEKLIDKIYTVSPASFRVDSKKVSYVGHGVDTVNKFLLKKIFKNEVKKIITVGRISKTKNIDLIVQAFIQIAREDIFLYIVGDLNDDANKEYINYIRSLIPESLKQNIIFTGLINFSKLPELYNSMDLAINLSDTGSLDKAIIEPMAMGIPIITSNDSAKELFYHLKDKGVFLIEKEQLTKNLENVITNATNIDRNSLRNEIVQNHSLQNLAKKIVSEFKNES